MVGQLDSRLEGGPYDGACGVVDEPPPSTLRLWPCGPSCRCPEGSGLHYYADGRPGGVEYRLAGVNEAGWAVYWYGRLDPRPLRASARELILT